MTPLVWVNFPLALMFLLAWAGIPLWMVIKRPDTAPDFSEAHAYLAAKAARPVAADPEPAAPRSLPARALAVARAVSGKAAPE